MGRPLLGEEDYVQAKGLLVFKGCRTQAGEDFLGVRWCARYHRRAIYAAQLASIVGGLVEQGKCVGQCRRSAGGNPRCVTAAGQGYDVRPRICGLVEMRDGEQRGRGLGEGRSSDGSGECGDDCDLFHGVSPFRVMVWTSLRPGVV